MRVASVRGRLSRALQCSALSSTQWAIHAGHHQGCCGHEHSSGCWSCIDLWHVGSSMGTTLYARERCGLSWRCLRVANTNTARTCCYRRPGFLPWTAAAAGRTLGSPQSAAPQAPPSHDGSLHRSQHHCLACMTEAVPYPCRQMLTPRERENLQLAEFPGAEITCSAEVT